MFAGGSDAAAVIGTASAREYVAALRALDRRALLVPLLFLVYVAGLASISTFLSIFLVRERGLDATIVGVAVMLQNLVRAVIAPFLGSLSDRYGRRALLLASAAASAALAPGFLLIVDVPTLIAWNLVFGIAQAAFFPVGVALLLDLTPPERHQSVMALNTGALNVGYTLAIAPSGFIAERGFAWLAAWSAVQFVIVSLALLLTLRGPLPREEPGRDRGIFGNALHAFIDPAFLWLSALALTFPLALGLLVSVLPLYAAEVGWTVGAIGLLLAVNGVVVALFSVPVNVPLDRLGPFRSLPVACLIAAVSELALLEGSPASLVVAVAGLGLSEVVFAASLPAAIALLTPRGARGAYQGAWAMISAVGFGAPLIVAGLTRGTIGWGPTWAFFGTLALVGTLAMAASVGPLSREALLRQGRLS